MKTGPKIDNGFPEIKILLRKKLLRNINPENALDLFAGEGRMLRETAPFFRSVYAVEKDPKKYLKLHENIKQQNLENAGPHCMEAGLFIKTRLPELAGINFIDLDAYGSPNRVIKELFKNWRPEQRSALAVTDGGKICLCRGNRIRPADYFIEAGAEDQKTVRIRPGLVRDYELLIKSFWKSLARMHGFRITEFLSAWKKSRRVIYYGICIEPD